MFVLFQQQAQLPVFLNEGMILYDSRCIGAFPLRFESFCYTDASKTADHTVGGHVSAKRTFGNVRVESAQVETRSRELSCLSLRIEERFQTRSRFPSAEGPDL